MTGLLPTPADQYHSFVVTGKSREVVAARTFEVKIAPPLAARRIEVIERFGDPEPLDTSGVWLIVPIQLESLEEPLTVRGARVRTRSGRTYQVTQRVPSSHNPTQAILQPGIPQIGGLLFEIPPGEIDGAVLEVAEYDDPQLDTKVEIPLDTSKDPAENIDPTFELPAVTAP